MENTTVHKEATEIATGIEEQVRIVLGEADYDTILKVSIYAADRIKSVIPMYTGNLNPQWKLYDTVVEILRGRLNGR